MKKREKNEKYQNLRMLQIKIQLTLAVIQNTPVNYNTKQYENRHFNSLAVIY